MKKILVMGLPGAGKTTLSIELAKELNAVHFNADEIRQKIHKDLGFDVTDRIEHATRMGILCDIVNRTGVYAIAEFVCPTKSTRNAFGAKNSFVVWVDRTPCRNFEETTRMFVNPTECHVRVTNEYDVYYWTDKIVNLVKSLDKKDFEI
jgi:adenylylsulfate kinase-like enzyme